jgi:hypothetical protein
MSLSNQTQWTLKDKMGNPPPPNINTFIQKLDKMLLLPCPRTANELEMPDKEDAPREMNSFIVFRRQLAHVAKMQKSSDDGRVISSAASFIWHGSSLDERQSYKQIAEELKRRHRQKYPNYTYERRKRKTAEEDFIVYNVDAMTQNRNKRRPRKSPPAPRVVPVLEEQECAPITTTLQEQGNEEWFNSLTSLYSQFQNGKGDQVDNNYWVYDNECYTAPEQIPLLFQAATASTYNTPLYNNYILLQQQQQQQISPTFDEFDSNSLFNGNPDMGISTSFVELERPINDVIFNLNLIN